MTAWIRERDIETSQPPGYTHRLHHNHYKKGSGFGNSDIDLFIYGLSPKEANKKLREITMQIKAAASKVMTFTKLYRHCNSYNESTINANVIRTSYICYNELKYYNII